MTQTSSRGCDATRAWAARSAGSAGLRRAGGGGRGMRVVNTEASLKSSISLTQQEAAAAFQDDRIYIEKYL